MVATVAVGSSSSIRVLQALRGERRRPCSLSLVGVGAAPLATTVPSHRKYSSIHTSRQRCVKHSGKEGSNEAWSEVSGCDVVVDLIVP